jgi:RNA polymerase sigma-70 factor (ECF subfamily)
MLSDSQFLEQLVAHRNWMGGIATRMGVCGHDDREDVVQDATLLAWRFRSQFHDDAIPPFRAWLATIIRRRCYIFYRRSRSRTDTSDPLVLDALAHTDPTAGAIDIDRFLARLVQILPSLTEQHRTVLLASVVDDASYLEIAEKMKCELGTVRSSLFRARARLRELMGDEIYRVCAEPETHETYLSIEIASSRPRWFETMEQEAETEQEA